MHDRVLEQSVTTQLQQAHDMEQARSSEQLAWSNEVELPVVAALMERHAQRTRVHAVRLRARLEELERTIGHVATAARVHEPPAARLASRRLRRHGVRAAIADAIVDHACVAFSYLLLESDAMRLGDVTSAAIAARIRGEELAMRDELMQRWDLAAEHAIVIHAGVHQVSTETAAQSLLVEQLRDAHALERSLGLVLARLAAEVPDPNAMARLTEHRDVTMQHGDELALRLHQLGSAPAFMRQTQSAGGTLVRGAVATMRLAPHAQQLREVYAIEHRKLIAYAQLTSLARRIEDDRTMLLAAAHATSERGMASWLEHEAGRFLLTIPSEG